MNGPKLLTRVLKWKCNVPKESKTVNCKKYSPQMSILAREGTSAVGFWDWFTLFDPAKTEEVEQRIEPGFAVHYWNHMRVWSEEKDEITYDPEMALYKIFKAGCPIVESSELTDLMGKKFT